MDLASPRVLVKLTPPCVSLLVELASPRVPLLLAYLAGELCLPECTSAGGVYHPEYTPDFGVGLSKHILVGEIVPVLLESASLVYPC